MLYKKVVLKASEFKDEGLPEGVVGYVIDDCGTMNTCLKKGQTHIF